MKIVFGIHQPSEDRLRYAKQLGADGVTCGLQIIPGYNERGYPTEAELAGLKRTVESHDLELYTLRLLPQRTHHVLYGLPERDREIDHLCTTIRAAGKVGIPFVYFNLTPWRSLDTGWGGTPGAPEPGPGDLRRGSGPGRYYRAEGRGGAVLLTHTRSRAAEDAANAHGAAVAPYGYISADEMWSRVEYLYERAIPVAEEAGVNVGAHPDDPPEKHYRGVEQILNSVDGLKRLTQTVPSPRSGLLLCVGTLHEMGDDTMGAIEYFLQKKKIFGIHFRNPSGTIPQGRYCEDFLDEGDLDMFEVMRLFKNYDYQGTIDPDHAIGIVGDEGGRIGFAWELGYIKALRAAAQKIA